MTNVITPLLSHAGVRPEQVAIEGAQNSWTYAQLRNAVLAYAGALRRQGIVAGDRVLLIAPTVPEFVVAYLGIQALGAVVVPVNAMSTRAELEYFIGEAGCSLVVGWHELGAVTSDAATTAGIPHWSLTRGAAAGVGRPLADAHECALDDVTVILFTSGTTGRPKGAELTVGNVLAAGEIAVRLADATSQDRIGTGLPMFHVFGQTAVLMLALTTGATMSLLARFSAQAMLEMLRRDRLTVMCGVPTMWNAMLHDAADASAADFADLRLAISGGASLPGAVNSAFQDKFGCTLLEAYGLTETTAIGTYGGPDAPSGSVGTAAFRTDVQIRDPAGLPVAQNAAGEVYIKGPTVMRGYRDRPDATAEVLSADGWFRTGDIGEMDAGCNVRIVDRAKDLIIRGGYNVYPSEVEAVLYEHPDVIEAAVVGIADDHYGEEVAAVVVVTPGAPRDGAAIAAWVRERLSAYKIPRVVQFVDQLPTGSTGKILKRAIDRGSLAAMLADQSGGSRTTGQ
jgi:long-chain acyl-CoA synthetase